MASKQDPAKAGDDRAGVPDNVRQAAEFGPRSGEEGGRPVHAAGDAPPGDGRLLGAGGAIRRAEREPEGARRRRGEHIRDLRFAQRLVHATNAQEIVALQHEFVKQQLERVKRAAQGGRRGGEGRRDGDGSRGAAEEIARPAAARQAAASAIRGVEHEPGRRSRRTCRRPGGGRAGSRGEFGQGGPRLSPLSDARKDLGPADQGDDHPARPRAGLLARRRRRLPRHRARPPGSREHDLARQPRRGDHQRHGGARPRQHRRRSPASR